MNLWLTILGTFLMLMLACMAFMIVAFTGGGFANSPNYRKSVIRLFDVALFVLPGTCVVASIAAWIAYAMDAGAHGYWSFATPLPFIIGYFVFLGTVTRKR